MFKDFGPLNTMVQKLDTFGNFDTLVLNVKLLSVTNNSVSSRTATVGNVGAAIVTHGARSGSSRVDAVICN